MLVLAAGALIAARAGQRMSAQAEEARRLAVAAVSLLLLLLIVTSCLFAAHIYRK